MDGDRKDSMLARHRSSAFALLMALVGTVACSGVPGDTDTRTIEAAQSYAEEVTSCLEIPESRLGDGEYCDCPLNGDRSCDPDCQIPDEWDEWCGCEGCFPEGFDPWDDDWETWKAENNFTPADEGGSGTGGSGSSTSSGGGITSSTGGTSGGTSSGTSGSENQYYDPAKPWTEVYSCQEIPTSRLGDGEYCDCPLNGDRSCDPDCQIPDEWDEWCGCEGCFPEGFDSYDHDWETWKADNDFTPIVETPSGGSSGGSSSSGGGTSSGGSSSGGTGSTGGSEPPPTLLEIPAPDVRLDPMEWPTGWIGDNSITVGEPRDGGRSFETTGAGTTRFRNNNLENIDGSQYRFLTFWYYISDISKLRTDRDAQVEISSATGIDREEMNWSLHSLGLQTGWNFVRLELPGSLRSSSGVPIDLTRIRRFRLYHFVSGSVTTRIDDLRFTNDILVDAGASDEGWFGHNDVTVDKSEWQEGISSLRSSGTGTDRFRNNNLGPIDIREMKYLTFWYFIDDPAKINRSRDAQVEISSTSSLDSQEIAWNFNKIPVKAGWNHVALEVPQNHSSIDYTAVRRFRLYHRVHSSAVTNIDEIRFTNRLDNCDHPNAVNQTIYSSGSVISTDTPVNWLCPRQFVVDIKDYGAENDKGTLVRAVGESPQTKADCENTRLDVQVLRRDGDTSFSLGELSRSGEWVGPEGYEACYLPRLRVDTHVPAMTYGGTYRVIASASKSDPTEVRRGRPLSVEAEPSETPAEAIARLRESANAVWGTHGADLIDKLWDLRGTPDGVAHCRTLLVQRDMLSLLAETLAYLGATPEAHLDALSGVIDGMCTTGNTGPTLETFMLDYGTLASQEHMLYEAIAANLGVSLDAAGAAVTTQVQAVVDALVSRCGLDTGLLDFLTSAEMPSGLNSPLFGNCGNEPQNVRATLGLAGGFFSLDPVGPDPEALARCMNEISGEASHPACADPRATPSAPPDQQPPKGARIPKGCANWEDALDTGGTCAEDKLTSEQKEFIKWMIARTEESRDAHRLEQNLAIATGAGTTAYAGGVIAILSPGAPVTAPAIAVVAIVGAAMVGLSAFEAGLEGFRAEDAAAEAERWRAIMRNRPPSNFCPDFALNGLQAGYMMNTGDEGEDPSVTDLTSAQRPMNLFDRFNYCMCEHGGLARTGRACVTDEERTKNECLTNPWGPDDGPRAECMVNLEPTAEALEIFEAETCKYTQPYCAGNTTTSTSLLDGLSCGCSETAVTTGSFGSTCKNIDTMICGFEQCYNLDSCTCGSCGPPLPPPPGGGGPDPEPF